jgi:hypothetical protein
MAINALLVAHIGDLSQGNRTPGIFACARMVITDPKPAYTLSENTFTAVVKELRTINTPRSLALLAQLSSLRG